MLHQTLPTEFRKGFKKLPLDLGEIPGGALRRRAPRGVDDLEIERGISAEIPDRPDDGGHVKSSPPSGGVEPPAEYLELLRSMLLERPLQARDEHPFHLYVRSPQHGYRGAPAAFAKLRRAWPRPGGRRTGRREETVGLCPNKWRAAIIEFGTWTSISPSPAPPNPGRAWKGRSLREAGVAGWGETSCSSPSAPARCSRPSPKPSVPSSSAFASSGASPRLDSRSQTRSPIFAPVSDRSRGSTLPWRRPRPTGSWSWPAISRSCPLRFSEDGWTASRRSSKRSCRARAASRSQSA